MGKLTIRPDCGTVIGNIGKFKIYENSNRTLSYYREGRSISASSIAELEKELNGTFVNNTASKRSRLKENVAASEVSVDLPNGKKPVAGYIERLSQALRSEQGAIQEYQAILEEPSLPAHIREMVTEISEDEKDHMVLIAAALDEEIQKTFPNNTEELADKKPVTESIDPDETMSVSLEKISSDTIENTFTYRISSSVTYDTDAEYEVRAAIDDMNEDSEDVISFVSLSEDQLTVTVKSSDDLTLESAKNILRDIVSRCTDTIRFI